MKTAIFLLVAAYATLAILAHLLADGMMFLPPAASYTAEELPIVRVPTEDGVEVAVLHLPNPEARFTVVYAHGNAEDIGHVGFLLETIRSLGFAVVAFDYRGYGMSSAVRPTAAGAVRDLEAAIRYATEELEIPENLLVLYGRSVGSGPVIEVAARRPVGGVVVESGFASAYRVVTRIPLFPMDPFPNRRRISAVDAPVLIIHGGRDEVIPAWHGRRLFEAAPEPRRAVWIEGAGHNDLLVSGRAAYLSAMQDFLGLLEERETERMKDEG